MRSVLFALAFLMLVPQLRAAGEKPAIDVVFCIDCSGSMGGVIEAAKRKVWSIVNTVAAAKPSPVLRIGLIGYGNGDQTYRIFPLTDDLDQVYKDLMTFKDEGWGDEYVGLSIHKATTEMRWSTGGQVLRLVYVVGNETARQGPAEFDYAKTAPAAIAKGIQINTIYCGNVDYDSATPTWREIATLADGQYLEIARDGGAVSISTPYDDEIARLNQELNGTYLAYGEHRVAREALQREQDENAAGFGGGDVLADRAVAKASKQYQNAQWDLIDASREADFDLSKIPDDQLPDSMRKMSLDDRKAYIAKQAKEREAIQQKIKDLAAQRDAFVKAELEKQGQKGDAFDGAVKDSLQKQAKEKGFSFEE